MHEPRFRRLPRADREQQMRLAATSIFARRGFYNASMDEIAEAASISKPMLYSYLGSKQAIYRTCIVDAASTLSAQVAEAAGASEDPQRQLFDGIRCFYVFVQDYPKEWTLLHQAVTAASLGQEGSDRIAVDMGRQLQASLVDMTAQLMRSAAAERGLSERRMAEIDSMAVGVIATSQALAQWWESHRDQTPALMAERVMNLLWHGLAGLLQGTRWHAPETAADVET